MNKDANEASGERARRGGGWLCSTARPPPPAFFSLTGPARKPAAAYFKALLGSLQPQHSISEAAEGKSTQLFLQIQRCYFFILIATAANMAKKSYYKHFFFFFF